LRGAKGFANMMLLGTPLDAQSSACAPLMLYDGKTLGRSLWLAGRLPQPSIWPETDVGYEHAVFDQTTFKQGYRFLPEAAIAGQKPPSVRPVNDCLNRLVVFNNENYRLVIQRPYFPAAQPKTSKKKTGVRSDEMYKT